MQHRLISSARCGRHSWAVVRCPANPPPCSPPIVAVLAIRLLTACGALRIRLRSEKRDALRGDNLMCWHDFLPAHRAPPCHDHSELKHGFSPLKGPGHYRPTRAFYGSLHRALWWRADVLFIGSNLHILCITRRKASDMYCWCD